MKRINYYFSFFVLSLFIFVACEQATEIPVPNHYDRVPRPQNLSAVFDTTVTGKYRVTLQWSISSMENIRDFEIQRRYPVPVFSRMGITEKQTYVDSFAVTFNDTLLLNYFVVPNGKDRFVGINSDTIRVILRKQF